MGALASTSIARSQGAATGAALLDLGIDVDLAPVADVPVSIDVVHGAGRPDLVAQRVGHRVARKRIRSGPPPARRGADAEALPGDRVGDDEHRHLGRHGSRRRGPRSRPACSPTASPSTNGLPLIMLSNATYPAWDAVHAAGWSPAIVRTLLRDQLGFRGVTITDSLDGTASVRGISVRRIAAAAARAGTDLILTTGSEASTRAVYAYLVAEATAGSIPTSLLQASYARILALKAGL